jgi:small multidrug resistance pump
MHWINSGWYLLVAIPFGVSGTVSMKLSQGLQKWKPSLCVILCYLISFMGLTLAIQGMDMSIVYAIWSGIGTLLVAVIGMLAFNESILARKIFSLGLIIIGVVGIHLANANH